jgi:hypothetical protein
VTLPVNHNFGGLLRQYQSRYGDILLTFGGSIGVRDLSEIYRASKKHAIHFDMSFNPAKRTASEDLAEHTLSKPSNYFEYKPGDRSSFVYSKLSFKRGFPEENMFMESLDELLIGLTKPIAFYVRLLNPKAPDFQDVEMYFRNVIDPICEK